MISLANDKEDWTTVRDEARTFLAAFAASPDAGLVRLHLAAAQLGLGEPAAAEKTLATLKQEIHSGTAQPTRVGRPRLGPVGRGVSQAKKIRRRGRHRRRFRSRMPKSEYLYQADEILGGSFKNQAQWEKAIAAFQRVIDARPDEQNETAAKSQLMIAEIRFLRKDFRAGQGRLPQGLPAVRQAARMEGHRPCFKSGNAKRR